MKLALAILATVVGVTLTIAQEKPKSVTVPITLDHNRTIIDVYLPLPDGNTKRVRGWVDNGNPELTITKGLADKLGLLLSGDPGPNDNPNQQSVQIPATVQIGGITISLGGVKSAKAVLKGESIAPGSSAEINIPSTVLRNYDVVFDYPNRQLTIGPPGSISFQGTATKAQINPQNGLIQIASKIDGADYTVSFDAGSSTSLLSAELLEKWLKAHPSWPHLTGAIGSANMWGAEDETQWQLLRIPSLNFGGSPLKSIVVASFPEKNMKWYQDRAGVPTIGFIGASAFVDSRVGIDYAHSALYIQRTQTKPAPDMDVVGLTLRPEPDEKYTVIGVVDYSGKPSVADVKAGDTLVGVDGAPATGATMGQVWSLLGGTPGTTRTLTLERDGKRFSVDATVRRFLAPTGNSSAKAKPKTNP